MADNWINMAGFSVLKCPGGMMVRFSAYTVLSAFFVPCTEREFELFCKENRPVRP